MEVINHEESPEVVALTIKGLGKDNNGLQKYIWVTKSQLERLLESQYDAEERYFVFNIGGVGVRPCDIITFKTVKLKEAREWPSFRKYILPELEKEKKKLGGGSKYIN